MNENFYKPTEENMQKFIEEANSLIAKLHPILVNHKINIVMAACSSILINCIMVANDPDKEKMLKAVTDELKGQFEIAEKQMKENNQGE